MSGFDFFTRGRCCARRIVWTSTLLGALSALPPQSFGQRFVEPARPLRVASDDRPSPPVADTSGPSTSPFRTLLRVLTPAVNLPEPLPPGGPQKIPLSDLNLSGDVRLEAKNGRISLIVRDAPLYGILFLLAQNQHLNVVCSEDLSARISITLDRVKVEDVLTAILSIVGYSWVRKNDIVYVTSMSGGANLAPDVQGRQLRVFPLDYTSAIDLSTAVLGLLSPVGTSYVMPKQRARQTDGLVKCSSWKTCHRSSLALKQYVLQVDQTAPPGPDQSLCSASRIERQQSAWREFRELVQHRTQQFQNQHRRVRQCRRGSGVLHQH